MISTYLLLGLLTSVVQTPVLPISPVVNLYDAPDIIVSSLRQVVRGSMVDYAANGGWRGSPGEEENVTITALDFVYQATDLGPPRGAPPWDACMSWGATEARCLQAVYTVVDGAEEALRHEHGNGRGTTNIIMRTGLELKLLLDVVVRDGYRLRQNLPRFVQAFLCNLYIYDRCTRVVRRVLT